jgi:hypothetical protein
LAPTQICAGGFGRLSAACAPLAHNTLASNTPKKIATLIPTTPEIYVSEYFE